MGLVILRLWPPSLVLPRFGRLAAAGAGLFFLLAALAVVPQAGNYGEFLLQTELYEPWPGSDAEARFQSASMLAAKPRDPRARFLHALALLDKKDFKGAERDLRAGLGETALIKSLGIKGFEARLRTLLGAVLIDEGQPEEARRVAEPACRSETSGPVRETLDRIKLCG
jgi:hypothetical protein